MKKLNIAVIGGDRRFNRLSAMLSADAHRVTRLCPGTAEEAFPSEGGSVVSGLYGADAVVLPMPLAGELRLISPDMKEKIELEQLLSFIPRGCLVLGGMVSSKYYTLASAFGIGLCDYYEGEEIKIANAEITAEGAVLLALESSERVLLGQNTLLTGYGRIGKALAPRLSALGARLSVYARSSESREYIRALGMNSVSPKELGAAASEAELIINTVPAPLFDEALLARLSPSCRIIELASAPGGADALRCAELGVKLIPAGGLPGRYFPESAAAAIKRSIYRILAESEMI